MLWRSEFCWFAEFNKSLTLLWIQKFKVDFPKARNSVELRAFSSQAGSWRPFHLINRHLVPLMTTCIVEAGSVASCTQGQTKLYQFTLSHFITKKKCRRVPLGGWFRPASKLTRRLFQRDANSSRKPFPEHRKTKQCLVHSQGHLRQDGC